MHYDIENNRTYSINDEGERELLANFEAEIVTETRYLDGNDVQTYLTLKGLMPGPKPKAPPIDLPETQIPAGNLAGMAWVLQAWGTRACLSPGMGVKDHLRAAIQMRSNPKTVNIYRHLGWTKIKGQRVYLHAGGGITPTGNNAGIQLALPPELQRYNLANPSKPAVGWNATMQLLKLGPPDLIWPMLAATFAPLFGPVDYAVHVEGKTGSFKSEIMSLFASHYGPALDARHLPGSWSSTANALEAQAFLCKNAPFVLDDFVPHGTRNQISQYQATADKIIRSQGNQAGRARLTDTSNLQSTMYPRGIILSTGEDTPEGHSVRARMLILQISPGTITSQNLTTCQKLRPHFTGTTADIVQHLATNGFPDIHGRANTIRDQNLAIGHSRTPAMLGHQVAIIEAVIDWAIAAKLTPKATGEKMKLDAMDAIIKACSAQQAFLESADPADLFTGALRQILGAKHGHLRTLHGLAPANCEICGWTKEGGDNNSMANYKSGGPCLGWIDWDEGVIYLDMTTGYPMIRKVAGAELSLTQLTLLRRLKDSGLLAQVDEPRNRNSIRVRAEGHTRQALCMFLSQAIKMEEVRNEQTA